MTPRAGAVRKHSVMIHGHRTSFSLEQAFLDGLRTIAHARSMPLAMLIAEVDAARPQGANLSSALRLHVLEQATQGALLRAGPAVEHIVEVQPTGR